MLRDAMKLEWESRSALIAVLEGSIEQHEDAVSDLLEDVVIYLPEDGRGGPG